MEEPQMIHFSVGSATNSMHLSCDIPMNDPELNSKIDKMLEIWSRCHVARNRYDALHKGV